jgi:hypothetical protein
MDPDIIVSGISKEIVNSLKAMEKAKKPEEKLMYSETIKNLCDSFGVFINLLTEMEPYDDDFDDEDESIPF